MAKLQKTSLTVFAILALSVASVETLHAKQQALLTTDTSETINLRIAANDVNDNAVQERSVYVVNQSLPTFLRQAARRSDYEIKISKRVRGVLKKRRLPIDIKKILPEIAEQFDLKWHFQNKQLFVSIGSENTTRLIYLGQMKYPKLQESMEQAGIEGDAYDLSYVEESNSILVNGSISYIASLELLAESYNKNLSSRRTNVRTIKFGKIGKQ